MTQAIFPWQQTAWQSLWQWKSNNGMPHALLFTGAQGVGKKHLAAELAYSLICTAPTHSGQTCGECSDCLLVKAGFHPDILFVEPEEPGQAIKIDQVRHVVHFVNETALRGGYRVIIINPATAMNIYAANALLKTLEEPTENVLIILICEQSSRLLPTITSRCWRINLPKPKEDVAIKWLTNAIEYKEDNLPLILKLAHGAPLRAKQIITDNLFLLRQDLYQGLIQLSRRENDPLLFAAQWQKNSIEVVLSLFLMLLKDMLYLKCDESGQNVVNHDYQEHLQKLNQKMSRARLMDYIDYVQQLYGKVTSLLNFNRQLLLEELSIRWVKLCC